MIRCVSACDTEAATGVSSVPIASQMTNFLAMCMHRLVCARADTIQVPVVVTPLTFDMHPDRMTILSLASVASRFQLSLPKIQTSHISESASLANVASLSSLSPVVTA